MGDREAAEKLLHALNEAHRNPHLNQLMGQTYPAGSDPQALTRTWQNVLDAIVASKPEGSDNHYRWTAVGKDKAFKPILKLPLLKTPPDLLLAVVKRGTVSTNVFLRRTQNFALDMGWLPWPSYTYTRRWQARDTDLGARGGHDIRLRHRWQLGSHQLLRWHPWRQLWLRPHGPTGLRQRHHHQ